MANYRYQITHPSSTGLPEDGYTNVWHTKTGGAVAQADWEAGLDAILAFYNGLYPLMPTGVISAAVGAGTAKVYEVQVGAPGAQDDVAVLLDEDAFTVAGLAAGANLPMPSEVALCMSMVAVGASAVPEENAGLRPRSRYRGRLYLGPWVANGTTIAVVAGASRPAQALRDTILNYGDAMGTELAAAGHSLCVYSRSDAAFKTVETLQCDDSWDTIRSRGVKRTVRDTRSI